MSKANQIRQLHLDGKSAQEIAQQVGVTRSYVYRVTSADGENESIRDMLRAILREQKELRSEVRLALGRRTNPLSRAVDLG